MERRIDPILSEVHFFDLHFELQQRMLMLGAKKKISIVDWIKRSKEQTKALKLYLQVAIDVNNKKKKRINKRSISFNHKKHISSSTDNKIVFYWLINFTNEYFSFLSFWCLCDIVSLFALFKFYFIMNIIWDIYHHHQLRKSRWVVWKKLLNHPLRMLKN